MKKYYIVLKIAIHFWFRFMRVVIFNCFGKGVFLTGFFLLFYSPILSWRIGKNSSEPFIVKNVSPFIYTMQ
jgi:hypothetical protein